MRYEAIESRKWKHEDGRTASIYGAVPYVNEADKARWQIVTVGWTVRDTKAGTVGIGRAPWKTRDEAQAFCDQHNGCEPFRNGPDTNF